LAGNFSTILMIDHDLVNNCPVLWGSLVAFGKKMPSTSLLTSKSRLLDHITGIEFLPHSKLTRHSASKTKSPAITFKISSLQQASALGPVNLSPELPEKKGPNSRPYWRNMIWRCLITSSYIGLYFWCGYFMKGRLSGHPWPNCWSSGRILRSVGAEALRACLVHGTLCRPFDASWKFPDGVGLGDLNSLDGTCISSI